MIALRLEMHPVVRAPDNGTASEFSVDRPTESVNRKFHGKWQVRNRNGDMEGNPSSAEAASSAIVKFRWPCRSLRFVPQARHDDNTKYWLILSVSLYRARTVGELPTVQD